MKSELKVDTKKKYPLFMSLDGHIKKERGVNDSITRSRGGQHVSAPVDQCLGIRQDQI